MPVVKPSAPWNEELQGLREQYKSSRLKDRTHASIILFFSSSRKFGLYQHSLSALEHAPILFAFILAFMEAQTDTLHADRSSDRFYIYYGASDHSSKLERDHARAMNELAGLETFVSFLFPCSHVCIPS